MMLSRRLRTEYLLAKSGSSIRVLRTTIILRLEIKVCGMKSGSRMAFTSAISKYEPTQIGMLNCNLAKFGMCMHGYICNRQDR